jgi:signal peptidase II
MTGKDSSAQSSVVRAARSPHAWATFIAVLILGLALDISTKYWTFEYVADQPVVLDRDELLADDRFNPIPPHEGVPILPFDLLQLKLVINRGAVFGIGGGMRFFFIAFTFAALIVGIFIFTRYCTSRTHLANVALGLILAGGLGNLYDRIIYGVVRDFLHMLPGWRLPFGWRWPGNNPEIFPWVFNIADVMLLLGMGLLLIHLQRVENRRKKSEESHSPSDTASTSE